MHWWENYPWRMIQTNLREIDMEDMDAKKYVEDLKDFGATAVTLNTGGIIASYDTELEYHKKSDYLHGDGLGAIIDECHKAGIKVIARMDFSKVRYEVYEKHPEWAYRRADGEIVNYNGDVHTCPNSDYQQKYALEIVKEALTKFPFDGVFCNMSGFLVVDYGGTYHGPCHCVNCQRLFREKYGAEIPAKDDSKDPAYKKYMTFKSECTKTQKMNLHKTIRDISPEIAIDGVDYVRIESGTEIGCKTWIYSASSNARKIAGPERKRPVDGAVVDFLGFRYRDTSSSPAQMELRQWQNLANSGSTSLYVMGRLDNHKDVSCYEGTRKVFQFHKEHEELYAGITSAAEVMLIHKNLLARYDEETYGWIRALTESHVPFDEIRQAELKGVEQLAGKKIAILCDAKLLNGAQAEILDKFAEEGGTVIVTGETGAYGSPGSVGSPVRNVGTPARNAPDKEGLASRPQEAFPLKCMGVRRILEKLSKQMSAVFLVNDGEKDVFPNCADAPYIPFGEELLMAEFEEGTQKYLSLIPEHPFGPPERCYYTEVTEHPGVTVHSYGKGRGVYIPWLVGTFYYNEGFQNTLNFMQDVLYHLCDVAQIAPGLTPMVEVCLGRKEGKTIVQLVNTSGCFSNSFFAPLPIYDIKLRLPGFLGARSATAYNGGTAGVVAEEAAGVVTEDVAGAVAEEAACVVHLDKLEWYEIIVVE